MSTRNRHSNRRGGNIKRWRHSGLFSLGRKSRQAGAAEILQFAVIAPIALVLLLGIVEFSVAFYNQAILTNASRAAAREAIQFPRDRIPITPEAVAVTAFNAGRFNWRGSGDLGDEPGQVQIIQDANQVTVTLRYPHNFWVLPRFMDGLVDFDLVARTVMRDPQGT